MKTCLMCNKTKDESEFYKIKDKRMKKGKLEHRIRELKREIADTGHTIGLLDDYSQMLVKTKYGSLRKVSNLSLAAQLNSSESTIKRKKEEIVDLVCRYLNIKVY